MCDQVVVEGLGLRQGIALDEAIGRKASKKAIVFGELGEHGTGWIVGAMDILYLVTEICRHDGDPW